MSETCPAAFLWLWKLHFERPRVHRSIFKQLKISTHLWKHCPVAHCVIMLWLRQHIYSTDSKYCLSSSEHMLEVVTLSLCGIYPNLYLSQPPLWMDGKLIGVLYVHIDTNQTCSLYCRLNRFKPSLTIQMTF